MAITIDKILGEPLMHSHSADDLPPALGAGTVADTATIDMTLTGSEIKGDVIPGGVDHNSLLNYVANEHLDWTADQNPTLINAANIPDLSGTYLTAESDPLSATKALDNLTSVAINTSLVSDTDSTDDLGSSSKYWANAYIDKIYLDSDSIIEAADVDGWNALVSFPGFTDLATDYGFTDNSSNWDTAYGWGNHASAGYEVQTNKGAANGYAPLGADSKIASAYLPPIAITTTTVVASEAAQLALSAQEGDVAVRSDEKKSYIHNGGTAGTMADWTELQTPTDTVLSVDGQTGTVNLSAVYLGLHAKADTAGNADTVTNGVYTTSKLSALAATTSAELAGVISDETGSGKLVFDTSPALTTPTLGVASATSINKVAITAPATSATLTIADGKTLTCNNNLTLATNMFSYQMAGEFLEKMTACKLMLAWLTPLDNGTEADLSGVTGHTITYTDSSDWTASDGVTKGLAWTLDFDNSNDYITISDSDDFSFGNGTTDSAFSIGMWVERVSSSFDYILSKWDATTGSEKREWEMHFAADNTLVFQARDESAAKNVSRTTDSALSSGWHFVVVTYAPGSGSGSTFANGLTIYVDGVAVASTASNQALYVAMENTTSPAYVGTAIGTGGTPASLFGDDMGQLFITKETLTANAVWQLYIQTRGYYNL